MSDADLLNRLDVLESESAIRCLVARYFAICDQLSPATPFDELGSLFTEGAVWEGGGRYADVFGRHESRKTIIAMLRIYAEPTPHFVMNAHFLSSESLTVDCDNACGRWMMLQTSDYADGTSDCRGARLTIKFARSQGRWQIAHFLTQSIFSRQVDAWNDEAQIAVPAATE